jgi:hypothetical protein
MRTSENPLMKKLPPGLLVGKQRLLQRLGPEPPRGVVFKPHGLQLPVVSERVGAEKAQLRKRNRGLEDH